MRRQRKRKALASEGYVEIREKVKEMMRKGELNEKIKEMFPEAKVVRVLDSPYKGEMLVFITRPRGDYPPRMAVEAHPISKTGKISKQYVGFYEVEPGEVSLFANAYVKKDYKRAGVGSSLEGIAREKWGAKKVFTFVAETPEAQAFEKDRQKREKGKIIHVKPLGKEKKEEKR